MSIDITSIDVGTGPNTGTGIPVRDAFEIVNSNFANIGTFFTNGNIAKINVSSTITGQSIVSNTSITGQTLSITANAVVTGNLQAGSITTAGKVTAASADITGNVTAAGFVGAGGDGASVDGALQGVDPLGLLLPVIQTPLAPPEEQDDGSGEGTDGGDDEGVSDFHEVKGQAAQAR